MAPARPLHDLRLVTLLVVLALSSQAVHGRPATPAPPLPPPTGTVVNVSTEAQPQTAVQQLASNTTVVTINPANIGVLNPVPANPLVYYPDAHQTLGDWNGTNPFFNGSTEVTGVVFPEATRSVLFFGRHGIGTFCYGTGGSSGGECFDPEDSSKGTHAYPYRYYVWAYDASDLAAVRAGQRQPWEVMPYAVWPLSLPIASGNTHLRGATYDPATGRVFVSQAYGDNEYPVIHVFSVQMP